MSPTELQNRIEENLPGARVQVNDLTGTSDHYEVTVISSAFAGKSLLDQHRTVKSFFEGDIASGNVHALSLKTYTPEEWASKGGK